MPDDKRTKKELANDELDEVVGGLQTRRTGEERARLHGTFGDPRPEPVEPGEGS